MMFRLASWLEGGRSNDHCVSRWLRELATQQLPAKLSIVFLVFAWPAPSWTTMHTPTRAADDDIQQRFEAAVAFIRELPKDGPAIYQPSNEDKLKYYALYKQATEGANRSTQPGWFDMVGRYKWDAWRKLGEMDRTRAMEEYVQGLLRASEGLPPSAEKTRLVSLLTPKKRADATAAPQTDTPTASAPPAVAGGGGRPAAATALFQTPEPAARAAVSAGTLEELAQLEESLAHDVQSLRDVVLADSMKVSRLETWLRSSPTSSSPLSSSSTTATADGASALQDNSGLSRELVATLLAVEAKLELAQAETEQFQQV